ncbi:mitochondrial protein Pet127-domain-containing protein [Cristinia sonorae]|uniref:Mitochondrial protein Pet127-domain-containing protein n=1 Tax=Cristinia sonorae TaxID=1940300 RepID=A0A8K0UUE9_9AGAR|nr:mitochondrial protein Pet127-domain-containing protein [Cristinia sonorae]
MIAPRASLPSITVVLRPQLRHLRHASTSTPREALELARVLKLLERKQKKQEALLKKLKHASMYLHELERSERRKLRAISKGISKGLEENAHFKRTLFEPEEPPHKTFRSFSSDPNTTSGTIDMSRGVKGLDVAPPSEQRPIASLGHGLDRVLFNPGVHWVQDPRSRVYNFTPWLQTVPKLSSFDFDRVTGFIPSSRDNDLLKAATRENCRFAGSTSSLTGMLIHIYFLLSRMQPVNLGRLSKAFDNADSGYTSGQRLAASVILHYRDGVYLTDSDSEDPAEVGANILSYSGVMLEKFLTTSKPQFESYLRSSPYLPDLDPRREAYRYAKYGNYMMRSQLDCHDSRLPGTGVFDIKTRAAIPLRLDPMNFQEGSGYLLRTLHGRYQSFESEYYDLIRSAFLKYSFQARIGNMDGVLVTYHNTARIFGFQYIPLEEMDEALYGRSDIGEDIFAACIRMLEALIEQVVTHFPKQSVSCMWKTTDDGQTMHIFVEPLQWIAQFPGDVKPIVQMTVQVENTVDSCLIQGHVIEELGSMKRWSVRYGINMSKDPATDIRARKKEYLDMKRRFWNLPSGMDLASMEQFWKSGLGIGQTPTAAFDPLRFLQPHGFVQSLRSMARSGQQEIERQEREERGKKKVVWHQPGSDLEEWEQDVIDEGLGGEEEDKDPNAATGDGQRVESDLPSPLRLSAYDNLEQPLRELAMSSLSKAAMETEHDSRTERSRRSRSPLSGRKKRSLLQKNRHYDPHVRGAGLPIVPLSEMLSMKTSSPLPLSLQPWPRTLSRSEYRLSDLFS